MTRFHVLSGVDRLHTVDDLLKAIDFYAALPLFVSEIKK